MRSIVVVFLLTFGPVWSVPAADASEPDTREQVVAEEPEESGLQSGSGPVETLDLDAIVVSATRTERPRFTTPAAVSTIHREQIEAIQPYGFQDVLESIPTVSIQGGPRRIAEEPSIRGFTDEQVIIRLDGTRQNFNKAHGGRFLLDPDLIRSIEVLRGASSAVYGSGALGGVFVTETVNGRDLTGDRDGAGVGLKGAFASNGEEWSSFNTVYGQAGTFDFLGSFIYRDVGENLEDGHGANILATRDEITNGLVKLGIAPGRHHRIELAWDAFDNSGINPPNANNFATPTNIVDRDTERTNTRARYQFNDPSSHWFNVDAAIYRNEVDTTEFRFDDARIDRTDFETTGFELTNTSRLTEIAGDWLQLTYGVEFYTDEQAGTRDGRDRLQFPDAEVDYQAGFVQAEIPLSAGFSLIPGVRFDSFEYTSQGDFEQRDEEETSPRVALGWHPVGSLYLWTEYAEAFRAPSLTELFADGVHFTAPLGPGQVVINEFVPTPDLAPEEAEQIQIGGRFRKRDLFGTGFGLTAEAVWHRSEINNFVDQVVTFISGPPQFDPRTQTLVFPGKTTNFSVDAQLSGFEFDARLEHPIGYVRAAIATLDSDRDDGGNLAGIQPDRASLGAGLYALDQQVTIGAQLIAAADRRNVPQDALTTPGFAKTDLFVNYLPYRGPLAGWEFRLALDNIFDKNYRIHPNPVQQPGRSVRMTIARDFQWLR